MSKKGNATNKVKKVKKLSLKKLKLSSYVQNNSSGCFRSNIKQ